jgi:hypothetical protein
MWKVLKLEPFSELTLKEYLLAVDIVIITAIVSDSRNIRLVHCYNAKV